MRLQHVRHGHVVLLRVGVEVAFAGELDAEAFLGVDPAQRRAHAGRRGALFGPPLWGNLGAEEERQPGDGDVELVGGGGDGLRETGVADPAPRSQQIAHDFDGDLLRGRQSVVWSIVAIIARLCRCVLRMLLCYVCFFVCKFGFAIYTLIDVMLVFSTQVALGVQVYLCLT